MNDTNPAHPWWRKPLDMFAASRLGSALFRPTLHHVDRVLLWLTGERYPVTARAATAEEREQIWPQAVRIYPGYDTYLDRVGNREVPIFILARTA